MRRSAPTGSGDRVMVDNFVVANYAKELVSGGYKQAEVDAHFAFIQERIKFWAEKEKGIPKAF